MNESKKTKFGQANNSQDESDVREPEASSALPVVVAQTPFPVSKADVTPNGEREGEVDEGATLGIVPVRNTVLFPHNVLPFVAGKELTLEAVERVARIGGTLGIVAQRDSSKENPGVDDLFQVGTEAKVLKVIRFPDNGFGVVVQGVRRFRILKYIDTSGNDLTAKVEYIADAPLDSESLEIAGLCRGLKQLVHKAISLSPNVPSEAGIFVENVVEPGYLCDIVIPYLSVEIKAKQELLELDDPEERLRRVHYFLTRELDILEVSQKIHADVRSEIGKQQRKYYVREQLRLLQKELGDLDGKPASGGSEPQDLQARIEQSGMPKDAKEAALREVERMQMMQAGSPEYTVSFTYVNWLLDLPWSKYTQEAVDLKKARQFLDEDHYGLEKAKRRILEFLAVYALKNSLKGPIILFVGPPGVGKTSLGKSIARALGRKFARIALGGVRDEAEIRGHRRTYIGSMPGKIVDALKKAGSMDPVILFDEIDKLSGDHRGDPASALLEVLDSEQNHTFVDHYLNVPVDLSKVLFLCTANSLHTIPEPLRDRMEVIELSGYTLQEKTHIAVDHLIPKVIEEHGLMEYCNLEISQNVLTDVIQCYTREAGVRQLRRELASLARNVAREIVERGQVEKKKKKAGQEKVSRSKTKAKKPHAGDSLGVIDLDFVRQALGPHKFTETKKPESLLPGVATGLAYTTAGGDVLFVESVLSSPGTGRTALTGQLGEVMKESVQTALSYILANRSLYGVGPSPLKNADLHLHFPEGAVKKDGPSAGVAVFLALVSLLTKRSLPSDLAMTGEISLRGEILPVGGIKEKLVAAHRHGIKHVLIPQINVKDLEDLPAEVTKEMKITPVTTLQEAYALAFGTQGKVTRKAAATSAKSRKVTPVGRGRKAR